jgi:two-component system OmpR family response regulator
MAPTGTILIIDDSQLTLKLTSRVLEHGGYTVLTADSPLGVSSTILRQKPDLVLADVDMPALSGDQLVALIKGNKLLQHTRVVLHSDRSLEDLLTLCKASGADGVIQKTDNLDELLDKVGNYMPRDK